jgi:hypothetical protein
LIWLMQRTSFLLLPSATKPSDDLSTVLHIN